LLDKFIIQWSAVVKVSFIKHLFSHRSEPKSTPSPLIAWTGKSGKVYQYEVFPFEASFRPLPGNYIYAMQSEDEGWIPIYIAQTRDLHQRLEGHVRIEDAIANGATHMHAHYCSEGQAARCSEERDLLLRWHPVCNDVMEN
jgi:hypothetical protein